MSHEITIRKNSKAEMAYAGETPWHGLGQELRKGASIEEWIAAAGMDWDIGRSRVRYGEGPNQRIIDDSHVLFRSDNKEPLGIVSSKFKVVQPREVLEFFRDLTADAGFSLETAGTLFGGRRFWALAHIGESAIIVNKADVVGGYLLLVTGADGTLATTARLTTVRVVCNNTLSMAMRRDSKGEVTVSHRSVFKATDMKDKLGIARGQFKEFVGQMRELAEKPVSTLEARDLTSRLVVACDARTKEADRLNVDKLKAAESSPTFSKILALFNGDGIGSRMDGVGGTAWGWVNAVTEYVDHHAKTQTQDNRIDSAWFGRGDAMKTMAAELAVAE